MTIRLHRPGVENAEEHIARRQFVADDRDAWSEHQPTSDQENQFIAEHGILEYGRWHLGIDPDAPSSTKSHYHFPYGDFEKVHRCGLLSAEVRANQYKYDDVAKASAHLHGMIDAAAKLAG